MESGVLIRSAVVFSAVVVAAKFADFLVGKKGRTWFKDRVIFHSWFRLEGASLESALRRGIEYYDKATAVLFGRHALSFRSILTFVLMMATAVMASNHAYLASSSAARNQITLSTQEELLMARAAMVAVLGAFFVYAIIQRLSRVILLKKKMLYTFGCWLLSVAISVGMLKVVGTVMILILSEMPKGQLPTIQTAQGSLPFIVNLAFGQVLGPALLLTFYIVTLALLFAVELARRLACLLLERVDEDERSPITLVASLFSGLIVILLNISKWLGTA